MTLAKSIAIAAAAFGLAMGSAFAVQGQSGMNDGWSSIEPQMAPQETFILLEPVEVTYLYGLDENGDAVADSYLLLDDSDTFE